MRSLLIATALIGILTASASAQTGPNAREAYVERRGLIEADTRCRLLTSTIRDALNVSVAQARGSLLRAGWSNAQMRELDGAVVNAASQRACNDARTAASVTSVSRTVAQWANAGTMEFPGWDRAWIARRTSEGWRIGQIIDTPMSAIFGVRQVGETQRLTLVIPVARGETAPRSVSMIMRDPARARSEISLNQRIASGLEAGLPSPAQARTVPAARSIEQLPNGRSQAVFTFTDTTFRDLLALDPRESIELRVQSGRAAKSLLVEVGDIGAARAFLTIRR